MFNIFVCSHRALSIEKSCKFVQITMIYSRLRWRTKCYFPLLCTLCSFIFPSQLIFLSISPEAMCNISTLLESRVEQPFSLKPGHLYSIFAICTMSAGRSHFWGVASSPLAVTFRWLSHDMSFLVTGRLYQITWTGWDSHIAQAVQIITHYFDISHMPPIPFLPRCSSQVMSFAPFST